MARTGYRLLARRTLVETALLIACGLFMAELGPFGTAVGTSFAERAVYWLICIVGGGVIGVSLDELAARRFANDWRRVVGVSVVMTPAVTLLVWITSAVMFRGPLLAPRYLDLLVPVLVVSVGVMAVRRLVFRPPHVRTERLPYEPAADDPAAAFRRRLSAPRRTARLIAVEAEDHYLRIHTDAGSELITARFADALAELSAAPGFQAHRSWWVAADAIEGARWKRGRGELRLAGGLVAPVSRTFAPALKSAGWF